MDKLMGGKDTFMKGMSKIKKPTNREQGKFQFDIKIISVENLPITGSVYVAWKRGTKSTNNGKTKAVNINSNKSASFNHSFSLVTTLYKDKPPKKTYESKTIAVSIKEEKNKKSVAKTMLDLADFTQNLRDEQFKSIQIKQKKGGPIVIALNVKTKEMEISPDDEPATETDLNSNDGSDDEDGEDFEQDDDHNSNISTNSNTSNNGKYGNKGDDESNLNDLLGGGGGGQVVNGFKKSATPNNYNNSNNSNSNTTTITSSYNSTPNKTSAPSTPTSKSTEPTTSVKPFSNDNEAELNALLGGPAKPKTTTVVTKTSAPLTTLGSTSTYPSSSTNKDWRREAEDSAQRVLQLERQVELLQNDAKSSTGGGKSSSSASGGTVSSQEFTDLKKRFREISGDNIDLEDRVKELESKLAEQSKSTANQGSISKQVSELQDQLRQKESSIQDLNLKNRRLERDLQDKDQEITDQTEQVKYYQTQLKTSQQATQQAIAAAAAAQSSQSQSSSNEEAQEEIEYLKREIHLLKEAQSPSAVGGGTLELKRKIQDLTREVKEKDEALNKLKSGGASPSTVTSPSSSSSSSTTSNNLKITNLEKENSELSKQISTVKQENDRSKQEIQQLQQQLQQAKKSSPTVVSTQPSSFEDPSLKRENIDLKDKISSQQNEIKRLQDRFDQLNSRYNDDQRENDSMVNELRGREDELQRQIEQLQEDNQSMSSKMSMSMTSAAALSMTANSKGDKSKEKDRAEKEHLERQFEQSKSDLSREREKTKKLEREIRELKDRIKSLEQQVDDSNGGGSSFNSHPKSDQQERDENKLIEHCIYTQSLTFIDGVGSVASSLFEKLSDLNAFSNENSRLFNRVHTALSQCVERSMYSSSDLSFWLSNISGLIHLIKDGPNNIDDDRDPIIDGILIMSNGGSDGSQSPNGQRRTPSQSFYCQLENLLRETYSLLLHNIYNKLRPKLTSLICQGTCILDKKTNRFSAADNDGDINKICKILQKYMNFLKDRYTFDSIVQQFFSQTFHFISYTLLNEVLNGDHYCTPSSGFKIKLSLSKMDDWVSSSEERELLLPARIHFQSIIEAANLMVIDKSIFTDSESIISAFETLNILQIKKLLEIWKPDNLSPDPIPNSVIQMSRSNWNRPISNLVLVVDPTILIEVEPTLH